MNIFKNISENIILPLSDLLLGYSIRSNLKLLNKSKLWTKKDLEIFQNERLKLLINNAYNNVPYYNNLFKSLKLTPNDIQNKQDLQKLPILNKSQIKIEGIKSFTSSNYSLNKRLKTSSSGSTGEPLFYYISKDAYSMNIAANLRGWYEMDYRLGDRFVKLSQNPRKSLIKQFQDKFSNNLYLPTNPLIESNYEYILNQIEKFKPKIIRCYPDPLLFLAQYRKLHPKYKYNPKAITTTGNILFPETRREIEEAFGCKIFDSYSCEGNSLVFECNTHSCYHSTEEYGVTEVINDNNKIITKGVGRLISTDLWNFAHPFIRYDTQDYIEIDSNQCICGRPHLRVLKILGRNNDILEMENGRKFIVHNFTGFFQTDIPEINQSINQFQVVKKNKKVIFRLVVNKAFNINVELFIKRYWEKEMQCEIEVEIVSNISLTKSGKRKFIINE